MARIQSMAQELQYVTGIAIKNKMKKKKDEHNEFRIGLSDLTNANTKHSVKLEFQKNNVIF